MAQLAEPKIKYTARFIKHKLFVGSKPKLDGGSRIGGQAMSLQLRDPIAVFLLKSTKTQCIEADLIIAKNQGTIKCCNLSITCVNLRGNDLFITIRSIRVMNTCLDSSLSAS